MKKHTRPVFTTILLSAAFMLASPIHALPPSIVANVPAAVQRAQADAEKPAFTDYSGWLKYLAFRAEADKTRYGDDSDQAAESAQRLADWTTRIEADPDNVLAALRGPHEWAYLSTADDSGQPFKIVIPDDYDPAVPMPLEIYVHGYSGNHLEFSNYMKSHTGYFEIAVLGRARGGFYHELSEADVLDVLKYVRAHWNIDPTRIRLRGESMGGFGQYWLGSRHPDLWASITPNCGFAMFCPVDNLASLPIYAMHSLDDPTVSIAQDHGPLEHIREVGGRVITEEINGFGHGVWNYTEGQDRMRIWSAQQRATPTNEVRHIDFVALDGAGDKAWWASVSMWGPENRPAHFILNMGADNTLYATLDNISLLNLDLAASPADRKRDLHVSVNGAKTFTIPAPLPDTLNLQQTSDGWEAAGELCPAPFRLHTPGGAASIYDGTTPILIVYGTQGDKAANEALLSAATAASKSPNSAWPKDDVDRAKQDGVSHYQNLYGNLPVKADRDVTDADMARCNLVLIGTAKQNSVVARMAEKLPVRMDGGYVVCDDGSSCPTDGSALALVHYNPLAPERLILWFASEETSFYAPGAILPQRLSEFAQGIDFIVMGTKDARIETVRAFDSLWRWIPEKSPLLPERACTSAGWAVMLAGILRDGARADFGISSNSFENLGQQYHTAYAMEGITHYADMAAMHYYAPVYTLELTGAELRQMKKMLDEFPARTYLFSDNFDPERLDPDRTYSVATIGRSIWAVIGTGFLPHISHWTGISVADAILEAAAK